MLLLHLRVSTSSTSRWRVHKFARLPGKRDLVSTSNILCINKAMYQESTRP